MDIECCGYLLGMYIGSDILTNGRGYAAMHQMYWQPDGEDTSRWYEEE